MTSFIVFVIFIYCGRSAWFALMASVLVIFICRGPVGKLVVLKLVTKEKVKSKLLIVLEIASLYLMRENVSLVPGTKYT